jgi:thioredoxin-related protein
MKLRQLAFAALLLASAPAFCVTPAVSADAHADSGIAWHKGDVDAAFALAKSSNKPLFLYWGAGWCPPCNQVKATIFNRQGFIDRSRFFVPVYIDGDSPSAQKLGARFKVRGYPTMILFKPDGSEITRLPGEVDGARYLQVLTLGMSAAHSVKDALQAALGPAPKLSADDWRLLSFYSWDTDEQQLIPQKDFVATMQRLAQACPPGDNAIRLNLNALAAAANAKPDEQPKPDRAAAAGRLLKALGNARISRDNMDILAGYPAELVELASDASADPKAMRQQLVTAWTLALQRLEHDETISKTDRLGALNAQVALARLATPTGALDAGLLKTVQQQINDTDHATTNAYERQSVISTAAHTLSDAGLLDQSDALLKAELKRSHSPYYFMLSLAANAKKRDDKTGALNWYEEAYQSAKGPATRLQWGVSYVSGLLELAPQDDARIEKALHTVLLELADTPDAFYERNRSALERIGGKLQDWNKDGKHQDVFQHVQTQLNGICGKLPEGDAQRTTCNGILAPRPAQL